jgi:hypothetical protein
MTVGSFFARARAYFVGLGAGKPWVTPSPGPGERWKIDRVCIRSRDSYFESDNQYEFQVTDTTTGDVVMTFWRSEYEGRSGSSDSGCKRVEVSEDGRTIIAYHEDGEVERHPLPVD